MTDCDYCGCEVEAHDPVSVYEGATADAAEGVAGQYCNYACLTEHVADAGLATGATCNWEG